MERIKNIMWGFGVLVVGTGLMALGIIILVALGASGVGIIVAILFPPIFLTPMVIGGQMMLAGALVIIGKNYPDEATFSSKDPVVFD